MSGTINSLLRISYSQSQGRQLTQPARPDSTIASGRTDASGFYPDSQIPSVTGREQSGLEGYNGEKAKDSRSFDTYECQTCKNRKYQDGSNDPGVSYKTPTNIAPEQAASSVRAHENEHVVREQAKAQREGRRIVSQSVTYQTGICPECGKVYVAGGTTRTVTKGEIEKTYMLNGEENTSGRNLDLTA
ncbi:MAG: hypothetical protein HFE83_12405 [Lachnospiraceae bacterium]|jgi:hypothetical protein|nr:hypothetical protein [Lachnospiraceae bacterium]